MKKYIVYCLVLGFAILAGGLSIAGAESDSQDRAYKNFEIKVNTQVEFETPSLLKKAKYKIAVASIPKNVIAVIADSYPDVRAFYNNLNKRIEITSIDGDVLASFPLLNKAQEAENFKTLEVLNNNSAISLEAIKNKTYFIGLITPSKSRKFPLVDLLYDRENRQSFVAGFTVSVSNKRKKITDRNISLLYLKAKKGSPKEYQKLLSAVQSYLQMLTFFPFNEKELAKLTDKFERAIKIIDELKVKYPEQVEHFEFLRDGLLEISSGLVPYLGQSVRAGLRDQPVLPAEIIKKGAGVQDAASGFKPDKSADSKDDNDRQPDGKGPMTCQKCTSPNVPGSVCTQKGRDPIKCTKDGKTFYCNSTIGGQQCPWCPDGQVGTPPKCSCPEGTYYINGSCREPWEKECIGTYSYRTCRYEDGKVDPDENDKCGCTLCPPPFVMMQKGYSAQYLECRDPRDLKPCPEDQQRVYDPIEGVSKCEKVNKPECNDPQKELVWLGTGYSCMAKCPAGRCGRFLCQIYPDNYGLGECFKCPANQEPAWDPVAAKSVCKEKCTGFRKEDGTCAECADMEPKGRWKNRNDGSGKCEANCGGRPAFQVYGGSSCGCFDGYTWDEAKWSCECVGEGKEVANCPYETRQCCVDKCKQGTFRNTDGRCVSCAELGKQECASTCCEIGQACINNTCQACNAMNPCNTNNGGCAQTENCVSQTVPGSANPVCYSDAEPVCECKKATCGESGACCAEGQECLDNSCKTCNEVNPCATNNGGCDAGAVCVPNPTQVGGKTCHGEPSCNCESGLTCPLPGEATQCCAEGQVCGENESGCVVPVVSPAEPEPNCGSNTCLGTIESTCCGVNNTCVNATCPDVNGQKRYYDAADCFCKTVTPVVSPIVEPPPVETNTPPVVDICSGKSNSCNLHPAFNYNCCKSGYACKTDGIGYYCGKV